MSASNKRKWIIYMYTFPNGKRYIGKTSTSLKERQGGSNWSGYSHCSVLMKAVRKYGIENIIQEVLFESEMTDEYSSRLEQMCILLFKTNCRRFKKPQYGYNTTDGGEGTIGHRHTEESKRKMSKSKKGKMTGENHPNSKQIYCIELDTTFVSGVDAEKYTGVDKRNISRALHSRKRKTHGGNTSFDELHWVFESEKTDEFISNVMSTPAILFRYNNTSGVRGVYFNTEKNKWIAQMGHNGNKYSLGGYETKEEAIIARLQAEKEHYGSTAPQAYLFEQYNI